MFSWGHRNPQGIDWHPLTGDLWETEHGNVGNDEVNVVDAGFDIARLPLRRFVSSPEQVPEAITEIAGRFTRAF